jgi:hypothetical protein
LLALVAILTAFGVIPEIQAGPALGVATTLAKSVYLLAWSATDLEIQMNSADRLMVSSATEDADRKCRYVDAA